MVDQVSIARGTADKIQFWTIKAQLQTLTPLKHCLITSLTAAPAAMKGPCYQEIVVLNLAARNQGTEDEVLSCRK